MTELSADPFRVVVNRADLSACRRPTRIPARGDRHERLQGCQSRDEINGFRLRFESTDGGKSRLLHEDKSIPKSRGCPNGYRIGAVQTFSMDSLSAYAVLIAVRQYGFEGPDYRWLAVTGRL